MRIPGSGKSTIAAKLSKVVIEADQYFYVYNSLKHEIEYNFDPSKLGAAHKWCKDEVERKMDLLPDIAVSNTFTQKWEAAPYVELAKKYGYEVQIITVQSNFQNTHGVPQNTIEKMKARWENFTLEDF